MKKFVLWIRDSGHSLESQQRNCSEYATENGGSIVKCYAVPKKAKASEVQKQFSEMWCFCRQKNEVDGVIIGSMEGFESLCEAESLLDLNAKHNLPIFVTCPSFCLSGAEGRLMFTTLLAYVLFEREMRSERIKAGKASAKQRSEKVA